MQFRTYIAPLLSVQASQVKFICINCINIEWFFMYKTIQSAFHKIKALQRGVEEALQIHKRI